MEKTEKLVTVSAQEKQIPHSRPHISEAGIEALLAFARLPQVGAGDRAALRELLIVDSVAHIVPLPIHPHLDLSQAERVMKVVRDRFA